MDNKNCKDCFYFKKLNSCEPTRCCHYLLIENKRRPCEPGDKCTVKIKRKLYNEVTNGKQNH